MIALGANDGTELWRHHVTLDPGTVAGLGGTFVSSPAVTGDALLTLVNQVGSPYVLALSRTPDADGEPRVLWRSEPIVEGPGYYTNATAVVTNGLLLAGFSPAEGDPDERGGIAIFDARTGRLLEHENTNAILKIDIDPRRKTFGDVVGSYKGLIEQYDPAVREAVDPLYHAVDAGSMRPVWKATVGGSCAACNAAAWASGGGSVFGASSPGGTMLSLGDDHGAVQWATPIADGTHYQSTSTAGGVVFTVDNAGDLLAWDEASGVPLLRRPVQADAGEPAVGVSSSGVAIASGKVIAATGNDVVAYAPSGLG